MALSLGFHIIFACIGMVMPFLMAFSHYKWIKTGNDLYLKLTKAWSRAVAIFFVTGAVSGTVLSFELGLLWPDFMKDAGPIIGMPFSLEGTAFFLEAIAFGFYLYGWGRFNKWFHWATGLVVGITGIASGVLVMGVNSWMNAPTGFTYENGVFSDIDPMAALFNDAWFHQSLHMTLSAFVAVSFAVTGLHALLLLKNKNVEFHQRGFRIGAIFAVASSLLQPISGDLAAKDVAKRQPAKLAALEAHYNTEKGAGLYIGGIVDEENQTVDYAIEIPNALSFLAYADFDAEVKGLNDFPENERPPVAITHYAFQVMVGIGSYLAFCALVYLSFKRKTKDAIPKKWILQLFAISTPLGFIAVEAGWMVTEIGRQPWIIYGIMRTSDALTPVPGIGYSLGLFGLIYIFLTLIVGLLMYRQIKHLPANFQLSQS